MNATADPGKPRKQVSGVERTRAHLGNLASKDLLALGFAEGHQTLNSSGRISEHRWESQGRLPPGHLGQGTRTFSSQAFVESEKVRVSLDYMIAVVWVLKETFHSWELSSKNRFIP